MKAFHLLRREYYSSLVASGVKLLGWSSITTVEELADETISIASSKLNQEFDKIYIKDELLQDWKNRLRSRRNTDESMQPDDQAQLNELFDEAVLQQSKLEFLLECCAPTISPRSQIIFILNAVCGYSKDDISVALVISEAEIDDSLDRTRSKLMKVTPLIPQSTKLNILHTAIYEIFMYGYLPTSDDNYANGQLCVDAMRLIKLVLQSYAGIDQDTHAVMALMCFYSARFPARVSAQGEILELETNDRSLWDKDLISMGIYYLKLAYDSNKTSRYVFEAAIASVHGIADDVLSTNWQAISGLYERLEDIQSNPSTNLKRAEAILHANGPKEALAYLQKSLHGSWLRNHSDYHGLLGIIYSTLGDGTMAIAHYEKALSLTALRAEKEYFNRKISNQKVLMN
jgi:predicted RNA polymerase sigma factor